MIRRKVAASSKREETQFLRIRSGENSLSRKMFSALGGDRGYRYIHRVTARLHSLEPAEVARNVSHQNSNRSLVRCAGCKGSRTLIL